MSRWDRIKNWAQGERRVPTVVLSLAGLLLVAALWLFYSSPGAKAERQREVTLTAHEEAGGGPATPLVGVEYTVVLPTDARSIVDVAGVLEPAHKVLIGAEVEGRVIEVASVEHAEVAAGDLLLRLDPALPAAAVERARASLIRAQAAHQLARAELRRHQDLSQSGVASTADLERTESEERSTGAQVAEARAQLSDARTRLAKTRIEAPFAGVVSSLDLEPGAYLRPGDSVAELLDLSEIEIEVGAGDRQILALQDGQAVRVAVDVYPGEWFEGRILRLGRAPNAETGKYPVPVRVPNPDRRLLAGMLGTVRFTIGDSRPALRIPSSAIQREFELEYLFVLDRDDEDESVAEVRRQRVSTRPIPFRPDLREVSEGLQPGERIAVSGLRELRQGLRVRALERELRQ